MVNKILIDTNVLLDYLLEREPFFEDAKKVILSCTDGNIQGCIAALSEKYSASNYPKLNFHCTRGHLTSEKIQRLENLMDIE